jgi:tetratricopeptide (TPR) repeat protein
MIVKNEASILGRCLKSVADIADELVIVDTGSTDDTVKIAREYGAKIIEEPWRDDFSYARNISLDNASSGWILWLDADDIVPAQSSAKIQSLKSSAPDKVYGFVIRNQKPGNTGTEFVQARMFPNDRRIRFERKIHEQMMPDALRLGLKLHKVDVVIEHHGYAVPDQMKQKASRNLKLLLDEYALHGPDAVTALEIGDSWQLAEQDENAVIWYRKTIEIPECRKKTPALAGQALLGLGAIANRKGQHQDAISYLEQALECSPWRPDIHYSLSVAFEMSGDSKQATEHLRLILAMKDEPGQVGVDFRGARLKTYLRLIRLLAEQNDITGATRVADQSLAHFPERAEIHLAFGKVLLKAGKLIDALHAFEKSITLNRNDNLDSFIGLCVIYKKAGADSRVNETLQAIAPLFENREKFRAFRSFFADPLSESDQASVAVEYEQIRKEFYQVF